MTVLQSKRTGAKVCLKTPMIGIVISSLEVDSFYAKIAYLSIRINFFYCLCSLYLYAIYRLLIAI
jgi:hypothetical protein